ncbi:MAG: hypothetical protein ABLQ96_01465, partial [Candidatus Acidiferrum sp.]
MNIKSIVPRVCVSVFVFLSTISVTQAQTASELQDHPSNRTNAADHWPQQAVLGAHAMVATDEALGSQAGVEILKRGGNAVDAAVAVA